MMFSSEKTRFEQLLLTKIAIKTIIFTKFLAYVKKKQYLCSRFLQNGQLDRRDVGIGRQERLKIFCPVMGVWVQVPLAVLRAKKKTKHHLQFHWQDDNLSSFFSIAINNCFQLSLIIDLQKSFA